jgi:hypothetical protein
MMPEPGLPPLSPDLYCVPACVAQEPKTRLNEVVDELENRLRDGGPE